ncbi:MAG: biotin transporter BioY [Dethiobacteria bacterium]
MQKLTLSALFTALIAVLAQIAVPLPFSPVPLTGQVIGVMLAGALLGSRAGTLSITAYLLLGAAGAPVFSMGRGGFYMISGPTGGYLWGFIPAVYFAGLIMEKVENPSIYRTAAAMLTALSFIYLGGALQLGLIMRYNLWQTLLAGVIPFLPLDLFKAFLAAFLARLIKKSLQLNQLDHILK